ncbi:MAG TPA: deoxyribose-phosphate aldolase [Clostridiaceae bacterium]|jgi:deoxyribose-phosphate aldolase|nr:deoxyribose-phosphate aldolase [Clostridiaceae bacterium]
MIDSKSLTASSLAKLIDQTYLKHHVTQDEIKKKCEEAISYQFKTFVVNTGMISFCKEILEGTGVLIDTGISFPLGQSTIKTKVFETIDAIEEGADEADYVCNIVKVKSADWRYIEEEMKQIVEVCKERNVVSKVIFENCYLNDDEIKHLCEISSKIKPDFIKTSTGCGPGGATVKDVVTMRTYTDKSVKVKAAGGIQTLQSVLDLIEAGAERIGASKGVEIVEEFKNKGLLL